MKREGIDAADQLADEMLKAIALASKFGLADRLQRMIADECRRASENSGKETLQPEISIWLDTTGIPAMLTELDRLKHREVLLDTGNPRVDLGMNLKERDHELTNVRRGIKNLETQLATAIPMEPSRETRHMSTKILLREMIEFKRKYGRAMSKEVFLRIAPRAYDEAGEPRPVDRTLHNKYRDLCKQVESN